MRSRNGFGGAVHPVRVDVSGERGPHIVALLASVAGTALIAALFSRPLAFVRSTGGEDTVVEIVFLDAVKPPPPGRKHVARNVATRADSPKRSVPQPARPDAADGPVLPLVSQQAGLSVADDAWMVPGQRTLFLSSEDRLARRSRPDFEARASRLHVRMKAPITVESVLREAGKALGFWPPGYTDDPCPGISRLADHYRANPPANMGLLEDALDLEAQCRKAS
jgi:hypothetical protein